MTLALRKDRERLQTSYAYSSYYRKKQASPPRYYTPSRTMLSASSKTGRSVEHVGEYIAPISQLLFKALLIGVMSIGFVYCASMLVGSSNSVLLKILGLSAWSCGFVPLTYYLWNSKLSR